MAPVIVSMESVCAYTPKYWLMISPPELGYLFASMVILYLTAQQAAENCGFFATKQTKPKLLLKYYIFPL